MKRVILGVIGAVAAGAGVIAAVVPRAGALGPVRTVAATGASVPTVALDPMGSTGYVAWVTTRDGASDVLVASLAGGAPIRVNDRRGDAAPHEQAPAQVAVGPRREVYVLWQNNTAVPGREYPASDLRFTRSEDGGLTWSAAVTVNDDRGGAPSSHTFHDLVVASDGTLYASWIDSRTRDATRTASEGGHLVHHSASGGAGPEIRLSRSSDGGRTWGNEVVVDRDACPCCRTSLAVGLDGSVFVAWRKIYPGDVRDVVVARMRAGAAAFEPPVRVHADGWVFPGCPHAGPSVAVGGDGVLHVAWYTGREGRQGLWYARSLEDGRFSEPRPLATGGRVPPSQTSLALDGDRPVLVWDDRRIASTAPRMELDGGRPISLADGGRSPAVAAAGGRIVAAWMDRGAVRVRDTGRR